MQTIFDQLMYGATVGVEPDDEDLDTVNAPPGVDPATFRLETAAKAREIADLRRQGDNGGARQAAAAATSAYIAAFPTPALVGAPQEATGDIGARMFGRS